MGPCFVIQPPFTLSCGLVKSFEFFVIFYILYYQMFGSKELIGFFATKCLVGKNGLFIIIIIIIISMLFAVLIC